MRKLYSICRALIIYVWLYSVLSYVTIVFLLLTNDGNSKKNI